MKLSLFALFITVSSILLGQEASPLFVSEPATFEVVAPISGKRNMERAIVKEKINDGRSSRNKVIIGKDQQTENDWLAENPSRLDKKLQTRTPSLVFDGFTQGSNPSDPSLAVGPDHVFVVFNTGFRIFDKEGNPLTSPLAPSAIFNTNGCCDLTASYDNLAERWVISLLGNGAYVAVSSTSNPVTSEWYVYSYSQVNDYQKLSVWSDGYYMTDNTGFDNKVFVFERDKMILGDSSAQIIGFPLTGIITSGFYSPQALNICSDNHPEPGNAPIVYMQDDAWIGVNQDHIKLWTVNVDWDNIASSTISQPIELNTTPFIGVFDGGDFSNLEQPFGGSSIDALQTTIMNQAQFRKFNDHNSAVFSFVVDTDASAGERAGVRWYELRQTGDGQPWTIYQEGTYTSPDGKHAWNGSMNIDVQGNIALGYTGMSGTTNTYASSYYTGRRVNDPLNTMTFEEELIAAGNQNFSGYRYGDYGKMDIDPSNGKTFWHINEINRSGVKDVVGVFQLAANFPNDVGVASIDTPVSGALNNAQTVTVTVYNYGEETQSNFPIQLFLNGELIATETFTGSLATGENVQYTFTTTLNLGTEGTTYTILASTALENDEDNSNDSATAEVKHVFGNDVGVVNITSPVTGSSLGQETVTVVIENFGTNTQTNFPIYYNVNGGANVVETFNGSIASGETATYTFSAPFTFSDFGDYEIVAGTDLSIDSDNTNDEYQTSVSNLSCINELNEQVVNIQDYSTSNSVINISDNGLINDVNVILNITHTYTGDLTISLTSPTGQEVVLAESEGGSGENYVNTTFDDEAQDGIEGQDAPFTGSFTPAQDLSSFDGLEMNGNWTLSIVDNGFGDTGVLSNWTLNICSNDFMSTQDFTNNNIEFDVAHKGNDLYWIEMQNQDVKDKIKLEVYNMEGRLLLSRKLENQGNQFTYDLDMSYATPGVYIIRMTDNDKLNATKRIIVK